MRESIASSESESRAIRASQEASARASREAAEESARLSREAEESARLSREAEERNSGNGGVDEGDDDTPVVGGGSAGAVTAANTSSNASGASVSVSGYWGGSNANMSFSVNKQVKEFTFWVPDEVVGGSISSNTGNCTYSYNGNFFTVTMTYGSTDGSGFSINAPNGHSFDPSKIVLYSYVPGSAT